MQLIRKFGKDSKGVTMMEYALIAALVAVAAVTIVSTLGTTISSVFSKINAKMAYESTQPLSQDQRVV
jgi:pilus assembly protein Flp/PilA